MDELYKKFNFPAASKFYKILKDEGYNISLNQVKEFLANQSVDQIHKVVNKNRNKFKYITANFPNEIFQIDLLDYTKYSRTNKGYKWILICVDVFTRKAYAVAMKDKTAKITEEAFKQIIKEDKPKVIFHDMGSEFKGTFHKFVDNNDIIDVQNEFKNHNALGIIDRFSKTLKNMISKLMTSTESTKWVDDLPRLIKIYNDTPNEAIENLKPSKVDSNEQNRIKIANLNFDKQLFNKSIDNVAKSRIKAGDYVRIKIEKGTFTKGYEVSYSTNIYRVDKVDGTIAYINDKRIPFNRLMVVPPGSLSMDNIEKSTADKDNRAQRRLNKEGVKDYLNPGKYYA